MVRRSGVRNVIIPNWDSVLKRFLAERLRLRPRTQRDWPRLLFLIKGLALLNCFSRVKVDGTIIAEEKDVQAAFELYEMVATSNEMGLSPETWKIYEEIILPLANNGSGVQRRDIVKRFLELYGRPLSHKRLKEEILPALEGVGLVTVERNPEDRRETLVYCTVLGPISSQVKDGLAGNNWTLDSAADRSPDKEVRRFPSGPTSPRNTDICNFSKTGSRDYDSGFEYEDLVKQLNDKSWQELSALENDLTERLGNIEKAKTFLGRLKRESMLAQDPSGAWRLTR